jgi:hypothetical protein
LNRSLIADNPLEHNQVFFFQDQVTFIEHNKVAKKNSCSIREHRRAEAESRINGELDVEKFPKFV